MSLNLPYKRIVRIGFGVILLSGLIAISGLTYYMMTSARGSDQDRIFFVLEGSTFRKVAEELESRKIIRQKGLFLICARLLGHGRNIKAGEYLLSSRMPPLTILHILSRGKIITHQVTIPEGYTRDQIARLLDEMGLLDADAFLAVTADADLVRHYGISSPTLEGYLYPDTYQFSRGLSARSVVDVMVERFFEVISPYQDRIKASDLTLEQVVILASIVEKETGRAEERPMIADVFLNRLKRNMRLETDPTVIYGMENFDGNLKKKDLARPDPYNTYVIRGLPPGAIANPGEEAILAVLEPAETEYLYFVSKNDGSHHFSKTLSEHNRAVRIYQKNRRSRPGVSP